MLNISEKLTARRLADVELVLPFQLRTKSRLRTALSNGEEVGIVLNRGSVLRDGDLLLADDGRVVKVIAASERVSTVSSTDALALVRAAYHLGNRHVALQIDAQRLRYLHDHVLDEMVRGLGLQVIVEEAPFEPEAGAYGGHSHLAPHAAHAHG
jgi:urease accessory protein